MFFSNIFLSIQNNNRAKKIKEITHVDRHTKSDQMHLMEERGREASQQTTHDIVSTEMFDFECETRE